MPQKVSINVSVVDSDARAKLRSLGVEVNKLNTKKVSIKTDIDGNFISSVTKLTDQKGKLVTVNDKLLKSGKRLTTVTQEQGNAAKQTSKAFTMMNAVFLRVAHTVISAVTKSFKSALTEMKNVDTELTTISRITKTSISELDGLKDKAYEVGKAYGVLASDYLSAAAAFTRAGYRDQSEDLAELSSKLQIAGQVSADTANQLLIATDKAYKFNGSVTKLSEVMDKMTVIDHNYATSIEKIAEGMGIVAPVAAQAHMTTEELIASLGTITAVTQRSGSESARALRALILSILKDTTTEIDEGVTWTVDEINSLQDALKVYAPEVVRAAEATGQLIDPMEAIAALAKSYEDGLLTEAKLAQITSSLGGKLRSSQLLSLIQNYSGMYTQMMQDMGNAIGAVDADVDKALQSWDAKLNQLKTTFTQFAESLIDTDAIKGFIDAARFFVEALSNPEEFSEKFYKTFENSIKSLVEKLPLLQNVINRSAILIVEAFLSSLASQLPTILQSLTDGARTVTQELANELPNIIGSFAEAIGAAISQSIVNADLAVDITNELIIGIISAIPNAIVGAAEGIVDGVVKGFENGDILETILTKLMKLLSPSFGLAMKSMEKLFREEPTSEIVVLNEEKLNGIKIIESATDAIEEETKSLGEQSDVVKGLSEEVKGATESLNKYKKALEGGEKGDAFKSYAEAYKKAVELYEKGLTGSNQYMSAIELLFGNVDDFEAAGKSLGSSFIKAMFEGGGDDYGANAANYIRKHLGEFSGVEITPIEDGTFGLAVTDMEKFAESTGLTSDALWTLIDALDIFDSKTTYTREQLYDVMGLVDDGGEKIVNLTDIINKLVGEGKSAKEIKEIVDSIENLADTDGNITINRPKDLEQTIDDIADIHDEAAKENNVEVSFDSNIDEFVEDCWKKIDQIDGTTIYVGLKAKYYPTTYLLGSHASGTSSSRGGLSLVNEEGAELIYAHGKAWIAGGGDPTITNIPVGAGVFNARQTREILTRSGIDSNADSTTTLSGIPIAETSQSGGSKTSGRGKLTKNLLDQIADYIDDILSKAKEALQEQLDAIDEQIEKLKREHDAEEDANKLEELRLKILEAEKELAEAENERTVRYFNKQTGQWEWMADQKAVADAQKALQDARDAYDKELAEQLYQEQLQELEDQKDSLNNAYDELEGSWDKILKELEGIINGENSVDIAKLITQLIGTKGGSYAPDIEELLEAIGSFTENPTSVLDAATTARIMSLNGTGGATSVLSAMLGSGSYDLNGKGQSTLGGNTSIVGDTIYYINGVQIGSDMMDKPLSQILSVLPIYAN